MATGALSALSHYGSAGASASVSPSAVYDDSIGAYTFRKTAEIIQHPAKKVPPVADYASRCAKLIRETFPARSQYQMCLAAARATGASPDTFDRILSGITKSPDAPLMLTVMAIRASRDPRPFELGNGFVVRVTQEAHP